MPPPFSVGGGGGGGVGGGIKCHHCPYLHPSRPSHPSVRPVPNTIGFHAISFERIGVLD